ncbi:hypothetical protein ABL78_1890 [Leptomonas seymouri]|uniref:VPS9 domain-containing protein n=1 Tax=Leptomonas seymouri TaxID=5684 RepID=A0A0N0P7P3_LEPSE|nr:hypothetical protein ABL78_1890 [Leptomonas seymouri]|eukprot:KPI89006.1 hypothetical protein ABL78_1890 [Leptomonas seymouri]
MASVETRDVVKRYELQHNAFLNALRPGGLLSSIEVKSPCEALLVPRQVSLEAVGIGALLQAKQQQPQSTGQHSPPPLLSDLFGECHSIPETEQPAKASTNDKSTRSDTDTAPTPSGLYYASKDEDAVRVALKSFLEYHLLHFDAFGASEFTTLRGQRGAFSEDLDLVKRFGHIGQVPVLADADPLQQQPLSGGGSGQRGRIPAATGGRSAQVSYHPASLQIFIIDRPLMDAAEVRYIVDTLHRLTGPEPIAAEVIADLNTLLRSSPSSLKTSPQPLSISSAPALSLMMGTDDNAARSKAEVSADGAKADTALSSFFSPPKSATLTSSAARRSHTLQREVGDSDNESIEETIIIDDYEGETLEEASLPAHTRNFSQASGRHCRHRQTSQSSEDTPLSHGATRRAVTVSSAYSSNAQSVAVDSPPLLGSTSPNNARSSAAPQVTRKLTPAPPASSAVNSAAASVAECGDTKSHNSGGRSVPGTLSAPVPNATTPSNATHANVRRHEYSRECVKDYRRVVAADNDISYEVFEYLMSRRYSVQLAKMMSSYVSKNQQLQQPIRNNVKYNEFVSSCHTLIQNTPQFLKEKKTQPILYEGIERYVTTRLYHQLYNVCEDEKEQNSILQSVFERVEMMTAEQLDALPEVERHHVWGQAMFELDGMSFFKSPREKLRCGMRACELLSLAVGDILRQRRKAKNSSHAENAASNAVSSGVALAFGADEFLPCFLLLVLRARPLSYVQNIAYIEKFRYASLLAPEESYCFATLQSAMVFWLGFKDGGHTDPTSLSPSLSPSPDDGGAAKHCGSASVALLTSAVLPPPPAHAAPPMTEHDLLPSVRQASNTARAQGATTAEKTQQPDGGPIPEGTVVAQSEAPTVLDILFGWANRSIAPIVDEIGLGNGCRNATGPVSITSPVVVTSPATGTAQGCALPDPIGELGSSTPSHSHFQSSGDVNFSPFSIGGSPLPTHARQPDANARAHVRELLITQNKSFEQLTLTEIQMIVEEARQMLRERK